MNQSDKLSLDTYRMANMLKRIGSREARKAQEENRRRGIPNAYSIGGRIVYELPSGEFTTDNPFEKDSDDDLNV